MFRACGINAVLYYTPTILMSSGASVLETYGLSAESSSMLASGVTAFLMLPCVFAAMLLMDSLGRSQAFPLLQARFGLAGVFAIFCTMSVISWLFVFLKVPETKGLPLEVICDIFALSAKQQQAARVHED
ncbi:hypothetical protein CLOM_g16876 [Closterium sp. NIES-68]|nr:hypothetical protein CLOM_g16876 [Closterium sp. NIES-68]GJP82916.1 hypothetical protein CLOP_g13144 [Closterium sp. NIES-67]